MPIIKILLSIPLKETSVKDVADAFVRNFKCYFGAPWVVLTEDRIFEVNFQNELQKDLKLNKFAPQRITRPQMVL